MKFCEKCGCENIDEAEFCRNCGLKFKTVTQQSGPVDDVKVIVKKQEKNSIVTKLFYKIDKYSGDLRIAKTKTASIVVFIAFFLLGISIRTSASLFVVFLASIIFGLIFAVPTYIIGFVLGYAIDKLSH